MGGSDGEFRFRLPRFVSFQRFVAKPDLGLAKEFCREADWRFAGTPAYASPEQAADLPCDGRTDQYALALIAYEMLTGRRVFEHSDLAALLEMHRSQEPAWFRAGLPDLPETVCAALTRALRKDPNQRFATCEEFAVALGCQVLSEPVRLPEILRLTPVRRMWGQWRSPRIRLLRRGSAVYLALAQNGLWVAYRGMIRRWPLQAITNIERPRWSKKLHLRFRGEQGTARQSFKFASRAECRSWSQQLETLLKNLPDDAPSGQRWAEPVALLRRRLALRCHLLGNVEFRHEKSARAEVGVLLQAAMMGADALVDVQRERLPEFGRTVWRSSGTAIRAVDETGRRELRSQWFASEVSRIGSWMLLMTVISFFGSLLGGFCLGGLAQVGSGPQGTQELTAGEVFATMVLPVALIHSWPFALGLLLRIMKWPQFVRPAAITASALGVTLLASDLGAIIAAAVTGKWAVTAVFLLFWLDPVNFGLLFFGLMLGRRASHAYWQYRSLVPDAGRYLPLVRRLVGGTTLTAGVLFAGLLLCWRTWGGYIYVSEFVTEAEATKEREALEYFRDGLAKLGHQPGEAEKAFRRTLVLWQELAAAAPARREYSENLAATKNNLGLVFEQRGQLQEAEEAYREAVALYESWRTDSQTVPLAGKVLKGAGRTWPGFNWSAVSGRGSRSAPGLDRSPSAWRKSRTATTLYIQ